MDSVRQTRIRIPEPALTALRRAFARDTSLEQFAFATAARYSAQGDVVLSVEQIILPEDGNLAEQSRTRVTPSPHFQAAVYAAALQRQRVIVDIHTHTHAGPVSFSEIDRREMQRNAEYIAANFPDPMTLAAIVMDRDGAHFDAVLYDRAARCFVDVPCIDVIGRQVCFVHSTKAITTEVSDKERYARQLLLPGWNQMRLADLRVVIVGLGGTGSRVLEMLVSLGVGERGWIALIDGDLVERSNLPRIPYATPADCGRAKVAVAAEHAQRRNANVRVIPARCDVALDCVPDTIRTADVIVLCVDRESSRSAVNEFAVRYGNPLTDVGCDVKDVDGRTIAGGQVRTVVPGVTACLSCSGGIDPLELAFDAMPERELAKYRARGYSVGSGHRAAPAIAPLNALAAQYGVASLLALFDVGGVEPHDFVSFELTRATVLTAATGMRDDCPVCGTDGVLLQGDAEPTSESTDETSEDRAESAWIHVPASGFPS
ncbi:MAG: hypothetical protein AMXMBFR47_35790 [Planctomycetota bacterium]